MKYLFFIILISAGCRDSWRPKAITLEVPKFDSTVIVDRDSTRLNLVAINKEKYFYIGVRSDSTVLKTISDRNFLDSLIRSVKGLRGGVIIYHDVSTGTSELRDLIEALKQGEIFKFRLVADDKLKELRIIN